jgi:AraC-like DNA-binding protein
MTSRVHRVTQYPSPFPDVVSMQFVSDHHFPRHAHDHFGIGVLMSGGQVSWSGVGTVRALAGDVIMVNPGEIHDGAPLENTAREWRMIYLDPAVIAKESREDFTGSTELLRPVASDPILACRFTELFETLKSGCADSLEREECLVRSLVCLLQRHGLARFASGSSSPSVVRALKRIDAAPEIPLSLVELAALSGISRFQFIRAFAREVGITPHAYVIQRRVRLAQRLLANGQSVSQAAIGAGFSDQSHLTRAFVRQFGVTPGSYRLAVA